MQVSDTLAFLRGGWQVERELQDYRSGISGRFTGHALVTPAGARASSPLAGGSSPVAGGSSPVAGGSSAGAGAGAGPGAGGPELSYYESGELRFGEHAGPASRRLLLGPHPGGAAVVRFADGRFFYVLDLRPGSGQAEHACRDDHYLLAHRVLGADLLEEQWRVRGPAKDYLAITRMHRKPLQDVPIHRTMDGSVT